MDILSLLIILEFLEIRPGVVVGNVSKRTSDEIWSEIKSSQVKSAALVYPAKNKIGIQVVEIGNHSYRCVDHFGIPLIVRRSKVGENSDMS